jgi:hypothetical protein
LAGPFHRANARRHRDFGRVTKYLAILRRYETLQAAMQGLLWQSDIRRP